MSINNESPISNAGNDKKPNSPILDGAQALEGALKIVRAWERESRQSEQNPNVHHNQQPSAVYRFVGDMLERKANEQLRAKQDAEHAARWAPVEQFTVCCPYHQHGGMPGKECGYHVPNKSAAANDQRSPSFLSAIASTAQSLFDNRLGWSDGRNPYAPRDFWADLGAVLYGEDDPRVQELRRTPPVETKKTAEEELSEESIERINESYSKAVEEPLKKQAQGGHAVLMVGPDQVAPWPPHTYEKALTGSDFLGAGVRWLEQALQFFEGHFSYVGRDDSTDLETVIGALHRYLTDLRGLQTYVKGRHLR